MPSLPTPGADFDAWGAELNDWLESDGIFNITKMDPPAVAGGPAATNKAAIIAAKDAAVAAGGGTIYTPPGNFAVGDLELELPAYPVTVNVVGDGLASVWTFGTDGTTASRGIRSPGQACFSTIANMRFVGPGVSTTPGTFPANKRFIRLVHGMKCFTLNASGWHSAFSIEGDHNNLYECTAANNGYGAIFDTPASYAGDHLWVSPRLEGNNVASVAISPATYATCQTLTVEHGHFGFGPYAFYFEAGRTAGAGLALGQLVCVGSSFEALGNGFMYDASGEARIQGVHLPDCSIVMGADNTYKIAAQPRRSFIKVAEIENVKIEGTNWSVFGQAIPALLDVDRLFGTFHMDRYENAYEEVVFLGGGKMFLARNAPLGILAEGGDGTRVRAWPCHPAFTVSSNTLVATAGSSVYPYAVNAELAGVAYNTVVGPSNTVGELVLVYERAPNVPTQTNAGSLPAGGVVVPDPAAPTKVVAVAAAPRPSVGIAPFGTVASGLVSVAVNIR